MNNYFLTLIFLVHLTGWVVGDVEYMGRRIVSKGQPFTIECVLSLIDVPKWTKDGVPIDPRQQQDFLLSEERLENNEVRVRLHVEQARRDHRGDYRCKTTSRRSHRIALVDDLEDDQSEGGASVILRENERIQLFCHLPNDGVFPVLWFKDNVRLLPDGDPGELEMEGRNLTILRAREDDAGEYMCTTADVSTLSKPAVSSPDDVIGQITIVKFPAKVQALPARISIQEGHDLRLECRVRGSPIPRVTWFIGEEAASSVEDPRVDLMENEEGLSDAILSISNLTFSDRNVYTCKAQNSANVDQASVLVIIRGQEIQTNADESGAITLIPGTPLVLQCNVTSMPGTRINWYHMDVSRTEPLKDNDFLKIGKEDFSVHIEKPNEDRDVGHYMCVVDVNQDVNSSIFVQTEVKVEPFHKSLNLVQGDKLVLTCKAKGYPQPTITWYKDNKLINDSTGRIMFESEGTLKGAKLIIEELEYEDRAYYMCEASSHVNVVNTTILVRVKDKLAALWPFLGICAEVAILCTIIFVYEKKRVKPDFDESDTDHNTENKNVQDQKEAGQDVRQRK